VCLPLEILGPHGYLAKHQQAIESLSLITGYDCLWTDQGLCPVDGLAFKQLRHLSWAALRSVEDCGALSVMIRQNAHHLKGLEVDFMHWSEEAIFLPVDHPDTENYFTRYILGVSVDNPAVILPVLESLRLSSISIDEATEEIQSALHLSNLRTLKLCDCSGTEKLLKGIISSGPNLKLASLEVQITEDVSNFDIGDTLMEFLSAFNGLEEIYLMYPGPTETEDILCSLIHHKSTLRRLVLHQRATVIDEESSMFEEEYDLTDLSVIDAASIRSKNPFRELDLESIGICGHPSLVVSQEFLKSYLNSADAMSRGSS
jgi:hypothetical protein